MYVDRMTIIISTDIFASINMSRHSGVEMSADKITADKMSVDAMTLDEMSVDRMTVCL